MSMHASTPSKRRAIRSSRTWRRIPPPTKSSACARTTTSQAMWSGSLALRWNGTCERWSDSSSSGRVPGRCRRSGPPSTPPGAENPIKAGIFERCVAGPFLAMSAPLQAAPWATHQAWLKRRPGSSPGLLRQPGVSTMTALWLIVLCGVLAILYAVWAIRSVLAADPGTARMQEIAAAVREGAQAYLKRQYTTIGVVGIVIFFILAYFLGASVAVGFLIGAVLSGTAGFIGMNVSVRANVRTAQAAIRSLADGLELAFKAGAITGLLVAGLALLGVTLYFGFL